jgi:AmmeMemoRadiSam system protein B
MALVCGGGELNEPGGRRVIRKAYGSGRWFPGGHRSLVSAVEGYIEQAEVEPVAGRIVGAIAPHAGYVYSGPVAGYAFRALRDNAREGQAPETVVILGFSHRGAFPGVALMDGDAIATPVGETDLDREAGDALAAGSDRIQFDYRPHMGEHSAENEIPFAQVALPDAKLVVGIIGDHEPATREALAAALQQLSARKRIVVVASTDLLHDASYERVCNTDKKTLSKIAALDETGLKDAWSFAEQVCCGIGPVLTTMRFAKLQGAESGTILRYRNSGDDHPESRGNWVVGYGAVVFARPDKAE